ncbi:type II secretion system protein GspD [Cerasicoccus maritimus]|uniref:type II secretion system protein GspD n=1 Tax=Cerasicoccus maritimus TaxID=490089 RepID=UPI0028524AEA|nr:hypothetical protein [Cerasicoccus maritimus]
MRLPKTLILFLTALVSVGAQAQGADPRLNQRIECLSLRSETLGEAVRLISTVSGLPVVCTPQASKTEVSCYFTGVTLQVGLQAMCRAHDLWLNVSPEGVLIISTLQQHLASQTFYSADYVETITVKYPSVYDVGDTLKGLFRDRIVWQRPDESDYDPMERLENAMDRMDLLAQRSQFSVQSDGSSGTNSNTSYGGSNNYNNRSNSRNNSSRSSSYGSNGTSNYNSGDDRQQIESIIQRQAVIDTQMRHRLSEGYVNDAAPIALVYLSALPEINTLLIRSSDRDAVQAVKAAIESMDKPRGQVLLKVTVLAVTLDDSMETGVEWLIEEGDFNAGFADGAIQSISQSLATYTTGAPVFAFVSNDVKLRAKLEAKNDNVRQLANPTLLVADNEAANVFVGKNAQFLDQVEPGQTTISQGVESTTEPTPTLVERNIGLSLLITPRVHADRTITLRIMQERSEIDPNLRTINYGTSSNGTDLNLQVQDVDQQIVTSTLVADDKSLVILGGLVQEETVLNESGLPVLKDIPLLGMLFSEKTEQVNHEELIVLIQPYVLAIPGEEHMASQTVMEELGVDLTSPIERFNQKNEEQPVGRFLERHMQKE